MAHALGLSAVAEGVETREQVAELQRIGCNVGQGYWFAHPAPAQAIDALVRSALTWPVAEPATAAHVPAPRAAPDLGVAAPVSRRRAGTG